MVSSHDHPVIDALETAPRQVAYARLNMLKALKTSTNNPGAFFVEPTRLNAITIDACKEKRSGQSAQTCQKA
jgi:hypothetical protein